MKKNILIILLLFFVVACEKDDRIKLDSIGYEYSFSTELKPIAIAIEKNNGFVFVVNNNPSSNNYSHKIQKFNLEGELINTIIDFDSFNKGKYTRYTPEDMCIGNSNIFVLVQPMTLSNETWITYNGFCVLQFDLNGSLTSEYDFSEFEDYWYPSSIAYLNNFIYVTNGQMTIKKIEENSGIADDIHIPITNDKPYLLVTDMEIESEEAIYLTGQGISKIDSINNDVSGCHITKLNCLVDQQYTFYSKSRTGTMAAMPNNPGLAINDNGNIYLTTFYGRSLEVFNKGNELILQQEIKTIDGEETLPIDIAIIKSDIYIVDYKNDIVLVYKEYYN